MKTYRGGLLALAVLGWALVPGTSQAQELGVLGIKARSGHVELPSPAGFGVFGEVPSGRMWVFGLALTRLTDRTVKEGWVCQVYAPRINCTQEEVTGEPQITSVRLHALRTLLAGQRLRLMVGGGPTFNTLSVDAVGESGRAADMFLSKAIQLGGHLRLSLAAHPFPGVPLRLSASVMGHWINFRACSDPEDYDYYDPFCGTDRLDEVHLAASYILPRMPGW